MIFLKLVRSRSLAGRIRNSVARHEIITFDLVSPTHSFGTRRNVSDVLISSLTAASSTSGLSTVRRRTRLVISTPMSRLGLQPIDSTTASGPSYHGPLVTGHFSCGSRDLPWRLLLVMLCWSARVWYQDASSFLLDGLLRPH